MTSNHFQGPAFLGCSLLVALLSATAATGQTAPEPTSPDPSARSSLSGRPGSPSRIGARDKIEIRVVELAEFAQTPFEVDDDGALELPHVGRITAEGKSERELAEDIRQQLLNVGLRRATVTVRILEFSRPVRVLGAVETPGNHPLAGRATLLEVLLSAGGLSSNHGRFIHVRRRAGNGLSDQVSIGVADLFEIGDPAVDIPILAGDIIHVPPARTVRIHFLGQVVKPGTVNFQSTEPITLLLAISRAGGLSDTASSKLRILRGEGEEKEEITANYRRILSGRDADLELRDGDIVVVKESFF